MRPALPVPCSRPDRSPAVAWVVAAPFALAAGAAVAAPIERHDAVATTRDGSTVVHRETHWRLPGGDDALSRVVLYRCPDGTPFARKRLWGPADTAAPRFDFVDARDGYSEGVRATPAGLEVFWREDADAEERRAPVRAAPGVVFDAGFDAFVRAGWPAIRAGRALQARFLLPSRGEALPVRIAPRPSAGDGIVRLRMTVDTWYGALAPRTDLAYTPDGRLRRFEGIATIRDARGRHREVRIDFPPDARDVDVPRGEVEAALAAPLATGCPA